MDTIRYTRWSDDQLAAILNETGNWVVRGQQGQVLCAAASLGLALQRSGEYAASDAIVVAISRLPPAEEILVLPDQIKRLRHLVAAVQRNSQLAA
jgi:hypothetical protein